MDPAGGHAPHRPDAVVEDGGHHGFGDGGPLLFGKGRGADPQGPGLEDDEVARLPHGPLDILGVAEVVLQLQGDFGQGPDLVVGEAGGLGLLRGQGNFFHSPGRAAGEGDGFFGHPALGDGVGVLPAHREEVRGHGAVHGVLAQAPHRRNHARCRPGGRGGPGKT